MHDLTKLEFVSSTTNHMFACVSIVINLSIFRVRINIKPLESLDHTISLLLGFVVRNIDYNASFPKC